MVDVQTWLKENYEGKKDSESIVVKPETELQGKLEINGYPNLKEIFLVDTKGITELVITECPKLEIIYVPGSKLNKIKGIKEDDLSKVRQLSVRDNQLAEIDISKFPNLEIFHFGGNLDSFGFLGGFRTLKKLPNLVNWSSEGTLTIAKILGELSKEELGEIAKELGVDTTGKDVEQVVKDEIRKINDNNKKLSDPTTGFPNLLKDREVVDSELVKIKNNADKYQALVKEEGNDPVKNKERTEIDQTELTKVINAGQQAKDAAEILGVKELSKGELDKKLGGKRLDEIPDNKTLKELIDGFNKFKDLLKDAGINPDDPNAKSYAEGLKNTHDAVQNSGLDPADIGKQITALQEENLRLKIMAKSIYADYSKQIEMTIEIPHK